MMLTDFAFICHSDSPWPSARTCLELYFLHEEADLFFHNLQVAT
jgi:hypothetical protein